MRLAHVATKRGWMRQWLVDPKILCRQHLLGEHLECHLFLGNIKKKRKLTGFIKNGLVEIDKIYSRHEELVAEMLRRHYNHYSPLECPSIEVIKSYPQGYVNIETNYRELYKRCEVCRELIWEYYPEKIQKWFRELGLEVPQVESIL